MEIVSTGPLPVASVLWRPSAQAYALTVVCRATFQLAPGECPLAPEQDAPNEEDAYWNDDPSRSLSASSDLAPFKPRVDVLLVGNAYPPRGEQARSVVARLKVGDVDKSIEVFGAYGATSFPLAQPAGREGDRRGFGPIAPSWSPRRELLGVHAATWAGTRWMDAPLPNDIDPAFFNAAPRDQQLTAIRDDEAIVLENLHPDHPRLVTSLPGLRPRVQVERRGAQEEVAMRADTLWIDTARRICAVTWRGRVIMEQPNEQGRVMVSTSSPRPRAPVPSAPLGPISVGTLVDPQRLKPTASTMPFVGGGAFDGAAPRSGQSPDGGDGALPFVSGPPAASALAALAAPPPVAAPRFAAPPLAPPLGAAPPPFAPPLGAAPPPFAPPSLGATPPPLAPPSLGAAPPPFVPSMGASPPMPPPRAPLPSAPAMYAPPPSAPGMDMGPGRDAALGGVQAASDAARSVEPARSAEPEEPQSFEMEARPKGPPKEIVKVVWFDPAALPKIRKHLPWRKILADLELTLITEAEADVAAGPLPPEAKDRRTVLEVLLQGEAIAADGVKPVAEAAIRDDGGFEPPLALIAAELEMPFDEIETLKATAAAARPLASTDKRLTEVLDVVDPLLAAAWLSGSGNLAEGMTAKLREAFAATKRPVAADYLTTHADRMLLEQRAYQRRSLFDKKWIRSVMRGGAGVIPVYLPEDVKDGLPMFRRFRARMLVELDMREDEGETSPWAARVIALGRVITPGGS